MGIKPVDRINPYTHHPHGGRANIRGKGKVKEMQVKTLCGKIGKGKRMHIIKAEGGGTFCGMASTNMQIHSEKYMSLKSKQICRACRVACP